MANHVSHAALPFPIRGARFTILVPYLDADGDPTDPTTPDTERSIDAGAFADCTEEVSTISGSNGMGYITLSGDELDGSMVAVCAKVASGPKATLATLFPRVLGIVSSGTAQAGAAGTITLASGAPAFDLTGCIVKTTGGTGGGGGSGSLNNQARVITAYNTSTKVATVVPNWETNPASDTTYQVLTSDMRLPAAQSVGALSANLDTQLTAIDDYIDSEIATLVTNVAAILAAVVIRANTAQTGSTSSTIKLDASASATNDLYTGAWVLLTGGTGAGQCRFITGYTGATKVAAIKPNWTTTPDNTSTFTVLPASWVQGVLEAASVTTLEADAIGSGAIGAAALAQIADVVLRRQQDNVEASSDGDALDLSSLYGLIQQMQEAAISGTTLTVKQTDGSTTLGTKTVAADGDGHISSIS